jgi:hypothetical protein
MACYRLHDVLWRRPYQTVVFVEWRPTVLVGAIVLMGTSGVLGFWLARGKRWAIRLPIWFVSLFLAVLGASGVLFLLVFPNPISYSAPVYSPDRKMAARVRVYDASGFGGADNTVELFAANGFERQDVFFGEYGSVNVRDIRWQSNSELEVDYHGTSYTCTNAFNVRVRCVPQ